MGKQQDIPTLYDEAVRLASEGHDPDKLVDGLLKQRSAVREPSNASEHFQKFGDSPRVGRSVTLAQEAPLYVIADEILGDWKNVNYGAKPYLDAMMTLDSIDDMYYQDTARSVVAYFLSNASSWRGDIARKVKKELNDMLK